MQCTLNLLTQVNNIIYKYLCLAEIPVGKTGVPVVKHHCKEYWKGPFHCKSLQGVIEGIPAINPLQLTVLLTCLCLLSKTEKGVGGVVYVSHPLSPFYIDRVW